jgi:BSD domain
MFSSLGMDLREFVSAVAEETSYILDVVKDGINDDDMLRYESPLTSYDNDDEGYSSCGSNIDQVKQPITAAEEVIRRMNDARTYLEPLLHREVEIYTIPLHLANEDNCECWEQTVVREDVHPEDSIEKREIQEFLEHFVLSDKTEDIVRVLQDHADTVDVHFHDHVPMHVSYADFWERFFYRCDEQRVQREWDRIKRSSADAFGGDPKSSNALLQETTTKIEPPLASPSSVTRVTATLDPFSVDELNESWG